jgi:cysteine synthase A
LVEGTAGNTGIGFAHLCNARGYRCVIVMPDNQSAEKADLLRTLGADVHIVRAVPYSDPNHYQRAAARMAGEIAGSCWGNQFDNTANRDAHYATTGPEIWNDTAGALDAFVCATGTGGTLGGVALYLKLQSQAVRCVWPTLRQRLVQLGQARRTESHGIECRDRGHRYRPGDRKPRRRAAR